MHKQQVKVVFSARHGYNKLSPKIYLYLRHHVSSEICGVFVTHDRVEMDRIKESVERAEIYCLASFMKKHWHEFNVDMLSAYEIKYCDQPIWSYIYTDRFLVKRSYEYCAKTAAGLFMFFELIFSNGEYQYYFDEAIATLQSYIAYIVSKHYGARYISQYPAKGFDGTHHFVIDNPYAYNANMINQPSSDAEAESALMMYDADMFIKRYRDKPHIPECMRYSGNKPRPTFKMFLTPAKYICMRVSKRYNNPYAYMYYGDYINSMNSLLYYARYLWARHYYVKPDFTERYIYFPLHFQPEATTLVCAPKYEKQLFFIDSIAKSLPANTWLYVKEHYAVLGSREIGFYKSLKKYPNVKLIDPWTDSFDIIRRSYAVITLTGTAGFEAMLLKKPVIVAGNVFYENAPGVMRVDDIYHRVLNLLETWSEPSDHEILQYMSRYIQSLRKGQTYAHSNRCYESDNIRDLALSLAKEMKIV